MTPGPHLAEHTPQVCAVGGDAGAGGDHDVHGIVVGGQEQHLASGAGHGDLIPWLGIAPAQLQGRLASTLRQPSLRSSGLLRL